MYAFVIYGISKIELYCETLGYGTFMWRVGSILLRGLFINMIMVIGFISILSQLIKKYEIRNSSSIRSNIMIGVVTGLLGLIIMIFSIDPTGTTLLNFRNVIITLAAIYGGTISVIICGLMVSLFRIVYFGINMSSVFGAILVGIVVVGCGLIARLNIRPTLKWIYTTLYNLTFSSVFLTILIKDKINIIHFLLIYWGMNCLIAFLIAYYSDYCLMANSLFRKLQFDSTKDFLTGLNNVRNFDNLFNYAIKNAKEKKEHLSLLMIDIDFFKKINDTYGHSKGDIVLYELGKILSENCRSFDIVSRNGGEEFTVLLIDCPKAQAIQIAERIRFSVETHTFILSIETLIKITVSIGVASYPEITNEVENLLERADISLYAAKYAGRNKVCTNNQNVC